MNKYLLRRIGVASNVAAMRPSLSDCIEIVLDQSDALAGDIVEALQAPVLKPLKPGQRDDVDPAIRHAVLHLVDEIGLVRSIFGDALRRLVYHSGSQDFDEAPMSRIEDIHVFDVHGLEAHIEQALARREVNRSVDDVLPQFNAQVSALLGWTSVQPGMNPLKPEAFVRALQEMLGVCVQDESVRSVLLRPSAISLGIGMAQLYRETSDWLRTQGVVAVNGAEGRLARGGVRAKAVETELDRTLSILDKLRSLMGVEPLAAGGANGQQDFVHTVPAAMVALQDMKMEESMYQRLKRVALPVVTARPNRADAGVVGEPVLARARNRQIGRRLGEEVVRLLFDQMGQDERVPAPVRLQLRPLEPAMLRLAQADPRFFLDRAHPARVFMDRCVQSAVVLLRDDQDAVHGYSACVAHAVGLVLRSPVEADSFAGAWESVERSWGDFETARKQQRVQAQHQREHDEKRIVLAQRFADALMERFRSSPLPALVAGFLRGPWAQVLAETSLRNEDNSPDPKGYLALVDELVWSVLRPADGRDYARLVKLIPRLLARINEGLVTINYPQEPVSIFLDDLSALHDKVLEDHRSAISAARIAQLARKAEARAAPDAMEAQDTGPDTLTPEALPPESVFPDSLGAGLGLESDSALDALGPSEGTAVEPGEWADLLLGGVWVRARLTWISRNRSLYMFVSGAGLAHAMTRRMMDRLQAQGRLRLGFAPQQLDLQIDTLHGVLTPLEGGGSGGHPVH
jgi:hypothetical protein